MCDIAETLVAIWRPANAHCGFFPRGGPSQSLGWIAVTHVCQTLRYSLLSHRALRDSPHFLRQGSARDARPCRQSPRLIQAAGVRVLPPGHASPNNAGEPPPRRENPHSGLCQLGRVDGWPFHPAALSGKPLPLLRRLEVALPSKRRRWGSVSDIFSLPPVDAPCLWHLHLSNTFVPFNGRTLISLRLCFSAAFHPFPSTSQLLEILGSCSQPQELTLRNMIPHDLSLAFEPTIFFPNLTNLTSTTVLVAPLHFVHTLKRRRLIPTSSRCQ
jgi:hypothetical protein